MESIVKLLFAAALLVCAMISMNSRPGYGADEVTLKDLREKLVLANKILAYEKLASPFGHVSVRIPGTETLLISRSVAPGMVTLDDILVCDLNGKVLEGKYKDTYSELAIHTEVYKKRGDVNSVVHTHSSYVISLSMTDNTVLPFNSVGIGAQPIALYKKRGLIDTPQKGREVCDLMGSNKAVILKAHGAVIIGTSIEDAISRAVSLERMAKLQWKAMCVGKLVPFTEEEKQSEIAVRPGQTLSESAEGSLHGLQREWAYYEYLLKK
jgi:ribulose-5-phosphate 4-epimerase/fuculose-1-phosphate aldolase